MVMLLLAWGCVTEETTPVVDPVVIDDIPGMNADALLTRMSLDFRGVRPTPAELDALGGDLDGVDEHLDSFLDDPRFGARIRSMYGEIYLTEVDTLSLVYQLPSVDDPYLFTASLGEEPLRILERIANEDLSYTEIVTADWTMVDPRLSRVWPVSPASDDGWAWAQYTDGRPAAGVLSTNSFWWRYASTVSNASRGRANQISRIFLCNDYLTRPIHFERDLDLLDEDAVEDAIVSNPSCINCHDSLDPLAASLFGFWTFGGDGWLDATRYHPERERLYDDYLPVDPAYYGTPLQSMEDLGRQIASDPRFPNCAVEQAYRLMLRRDLTLDDTDALTAHREVFLSSGLSLKQLYASIARDPRYQAADRAHEATETLGAVPSKMVTVQLLGSQVEALTGFRWTYAGLDMLDNDVYGVRALGGGADGAAGARNATLPNATLILVQERLAEAAASYAVAHEQEIDSSARVLFQWIDFTETPETDRAAMVTQIQWLQRAVLGADVAADGPEVEANLELWRMLYAVNDQTDEAWTGLLTALLRDPDFLIY